MSDELNKFVFKVEPKEINYTEGKPLNITNQFSFYHNKNRFRKDLTRLQTLFKSRTNDPLLASGIRDSYLKEVYTENYLVFIFTTKEKIKDSNKIIESNIGSNNLIKSGCAYIFSTEDYLLLISKEMKGLVLGIDYIEEIFTQVLDDYFKRKQFDEYIQLKPFNLIACLK